MEKQIEKELKKLKVLFKAKFIDAVTNEEYQKLLKEISDEALIQEAQRLLIDLQTIYENLFFMIIRKELIQGSFLKWINWIEVKHAELLIEALKERMVNHWSVEKIRNFIEGLESAEDYLTKYIVGPLLNDLAKLALVEKMRKWEEKELKQVARKAKREKDEKMIAVIVEIKKRKAEIEEMRQKLELSSY